MQRKRLSSAKKVGFSRSSMHRRASPVVSPAATYMKQKSSFLVAALSLCAFIAGNMLGQHGMYAFLTAALGQYDDSLIVYTGTVTPVAKVPDYSRWSTYGGNGEEHTYRQVPANLLVPLPPYDPRIERKGYAGADIGDVYSVGNLGSYETGAEDSGSHVGVDIRVPVGTPVRSIANGIVTRVDVDPSGFGLFIVIRHPHMPDPDRPSHETVLHSVYAHLSAQYVTEGQIVSKGETIGLSGKSGFVTGPHLHFQVDRDDAPWHPYWPFSYTEAREAGLNTVQAINSAFMQSRARQYTVHPMLLVQADLPPPTYAENGRALTKAEPTPSLTPEERVALRRQERMAARHIDSVPVVAVVPATPTRVEPVIERTQTVALDTSAYEEPVQQPVQPVVEPEQKPVVVAPAVSRPVASVSIEHSRTFTPREWLTVRITLLDEHGSKTSAEGLQKDLYMRTAYGDAEFRPAVLSQQDFVQGVATVQMLPRGNRTVVIQVQPLGTMSDPIESSAR